MDYSLSLSLSLCFPLEDLLSLICEFILYEFYYFRSSILFFNYVVHKLFVNYLLSKMILLFNLSLKEKFKEFDCRVE